MIRHDQCNGRKQRGSRSYRVTERLPQTAAYTARPALVGPRSPDKNLVKSQGDMATNTSMESAPQVANDEQPKVGSAEGLALQTSRLVSPFH